MRKIIFAINITADGYCSHTSGIVDAELHDFFTDALRGGDVMLYGRVTYEMMVPYWPEVARDGTDDPSSVEFARVFDAMEKVVFSRTLERLEDPHLRLAHRDLVDEARALKQQPGRAILVGSLSVASQLSQHGLIDEYQFVVHPVLAGAGPRLFESVQLPEAVRLELVGTRTFGSGAVVLRYRRVG